MANPSIQELSSHELALTAPNRYAEATRIISLSLTCLSAIAATTYFIQEIPLLLPLLISCLCCFFLSIFLLSKSKLFNLSRVSLAIAAPLLLLFVSVLYKGTSARLGLIDANDYSNVRIAMLFMAVIPLSTISITEKKLLAVALLPSLLSLVFFDPIHNLFGVGYYQVGLQSSDYYFSVNLYTLITYLFLVAALYYQKHNNYQKQVRLFEKGLKLERYLDQLVAIGNSTLLNSGQVEKTYVEICSIARETLGVSRVSIWHYHPETDSVHCALLQDKTGQHNPDTSLYARDYPEYFRHMKLQGLIVAEQAALHPATAPFAQSYLQPLNIISMMDATFKIEGRLGGIICCEQQGVPQHWKTEDSIFLHTLADFLSYLHSTETLLLQRQELQEKNEEISTINEQLEERILSRTHELEAKNKQLSEYAFINSHLLRAPIARIAGLVNIIEMMYGPIVHKEYTDHIKTAVEELDDVSRCISRAIEEYGEVSRQDVIVKK